VAHDGPDVECERAFAMASSLVSKQVITPLSAPRKLEVESE